MAKGCSLYLPFFPLLRLSFSVLLLLSFSPYASRFCPLFFRSFSLFPIPLLFLHVPHLVCFARDFSWNLKFFVVRSQSSLLGDRFFIPVYERFNFFFLLSLSVSTVSLFFSLSVVLPIARAFTRPPPGSRSVLLHRNFRHLYLPPGNLIVSQRGWFAASEGPKEREILLREMFRRFPVATGRKATFVGEAFSLGQRDL